MTTTQAIYECSRGHQTIVTVNDAKINVTVRCSTKGCPETAYYQPSTQTIYETGATSHAVNDLILFTDNTAKLAQQRDIIYLSIVECGKEAEGWTPRVFTPLLNWSIRQYELEIGEAMDLTDVEKIEFCTLYANDFENWKKENNIK